MDAVTNLLPFPWVALLLALLAAAAAPALTRLAATRAVSRPVLCPAAEEQVVLRAALRRPGLAAETGLVPASFSVRSHRLLWGPLVAEDVPKSSAQARARLGAIDDVAPHVLAAVLAPHPPADTGSEADLESAVEVVRASADDRLLYAGSSPLVDSATPDSLNPDQPPMVRRYVPPTRTRVGLVAVALAVMAALVPAMAATIGAGAPAAAVVLAAAALLVLAGTSVVISLVDLDTMYVDTGTWAAGSAAAWLLAAAAAVAASDASRVGVALACVAVVWVLFEVSNLLFRLLRGHDGQGFGDTLIVLLTVGVPVLVSGDPLVAVWSVVGAQVAGIAGWCVAAAVGRAGRDTPFAFGPYLAFGWVLGLVGHLAGIEHLLM